MKPQPLRRYTDLPALLHSLTTKSVTLLSPRLWDDSNDSVFLEQYRQRRSLKSVLALCFTEAPERYHHWKVFAPGSSGVRVEFNGSKLLAQLTDHPGIRSGAVKYKTIDEVTAHPLPVRELPFLKRYPFRDENEYRVIYEDKEEELDAKTLTIDIDVITRVVLSPWLPKVLVPTIKSLIRGVEGCSGLHVTRTTLVDNETWKRCARK